MSRTDDRTVRRIIGLAVTVLVAVVLFALVLGYVLGQPVLLSYVETGSMEPTIAEGDGFIAIPSAIAGPVETGDVVVYEAQEHEGGGLTTHRVVDETEQGYVTKGDANFVTDQDGNEPHVTDGQITAKALQFDGEVVTIPHLGTAVTAFQGALESIQETGGSLMGAESLLGAVGLSYLLLLGGFLIIVLSTRMDSADTANRVRTHTRSRGESFDGKLVVIGLAVLLCVVATVTMVAMSGTVEFGIVSAESDSEAEHVVRAGETVGETYELHGGGVLPTIAIVEEASDGVSIEKEPTRLQRGESTNVTVNVTAPEETGYYLQSFGEYRYFAVLPTSVIGTLHDVHPWLALATTTGVVVTLFTLPFALLVGTDRIRTRDKRRTDPKGGGLLGGIR